MFHGPLSRAYQLEALDTKVLVGVELRAPVNVKEMRIRVKMDRVLQNAQAALERLQIQGRSVPGSA